MTEILLCGCQGYMGRTITQLAKERNDVKIIAGVDLKNDLTTDYPIYTKISEVKENVDVIIDFSHPSLLESILDYSVDKNVPVVIATTGNSDDDIKRIEKASLNVPVFFTYNMSVGVNLITELAKKAQSILSDQFDIEIIEKHHNKKIDAPSGTAIMIANALNENDNYNLVFDRHSVRQPRDKKEIGISSVRGGTIVGEHSVIFAGTDEVIELKHSAYSKKVFAVGAVNAAVWLKNQTNGLYNMKDII